MKNCILCGSNRISLEDLSPKDSVCVTCTTCGRYEITRTALQTLPNSSDFLDLRHVLSGYIFNQSKVESRTITISTDFHHLLSEAKPPKNERESVVRLLQYVAAKSSHRGAFVQIVPACDYPIVYGKQEEELQYVIDLCLTKGLLKEQFTVDKLIGIREFRLESEGWGVLGDSSSHDKVLQEERGGALIMSSESEKKRTVFIVHGRNEKARKALYLFLRSINLRPIEWNELLQSTGKGAPYVGEVLDRAFSQDLIQAVIVLLTGDDIGGLRQEYWKSEDPPHERNLTPQARQNVIFEAGRAMGSHPNQTVIVRLGQVRPFSDIEGVHYVKLSDAINSRQELATKLRTAGCSVNLDGSDWHSAGDFDEALLPFEQVNQEEVAEILSEPEESISQKALDIIVSAHRNGGEIHLHDGLGEMGPWVATREKHFADQSDPSYAADYLDAFEELQANDLVRYVSGILYHLTGKGHRIAKLQELESGTT